MQHLDQLNTNIQHSKINILTSSHNRPAIFIYLPFFHNILIEDTEIPAIQYFLQENQNIGIYAKRVIVPRRFTFAKHVYKADTYYNNIRESLKGRIVKYSLEKTLPVGQSLIYDCSPFLAAYEKYSSAYNLKMRIGSLFDNIAKTYSALTTMYPDRMVVLILHDDNKSSLGSEILHFLKLNNYQITKCSDRVVLMFNNDSFIPAFIEDKKDNSVLVLNRIMKSFVFPENSIDTNSTPILKNITDKALAQFGDNIKEEELVIFKKALTDYTLYNTEAAETINKDIDNPEKLKKFVLDALNAASKAEVKNLNDVATTVKKIGSSNKYSTPLRTDLLVNGVQPIKLTQLEEIHNMNRHKVEFQDTIHFIMKNIIQVLTKDSINIKIKNIEHRVIDNNSSRYIEYKVKIQHDIGYTRPYPLIFRIPYLVDEKYFKIKGQKYILMNQLFGKVLVKTAPDKVRLLSNYAPLSLIIKNANQTAAAVNDVILEFLNKVEQTSNKVTREPFSDNDKEQFMEKTGLSIDLIKDLPFKKLNIQLKDSETINFDFTQDRFYYNKKNNIEYYATFENQSIVVNNNGSISDPIPMSFFNEYLFDLIQKHTLSIFGEDINKKKSRGRNYIALHVAGIKIPAIYYFIWKFGIRKTFEIFNTRYLLDTKKDKEAEFSISMINKDGNRLYLNIFPASNRERFIFAGLEFIKNKKVFFTNLDDNTILNDFLKKEYSEMFLKNLDRTTQGIIDPIIEKLLILEHRPTNLPELISKDMLDMLLNGAVDSANDMGNMRVRLSEVIYGLVYHQLQTALSHFKVNVLDDSKLVIYPDFIMQQLVTESMLLQYVQSNNPIEEISLSTRITMSGLGNPPTDALRLQHRDIDFKSMYGNISATQTNEYANIGVIKQFTNSAIIENDYGYFAENQKPDNPFKILSPVESLIICPERNDAQRLTMGQQQFSQFIPTAARNVPFVQTGFEGIIPQISSPRFVFKAKRDGVILSLDNNFIKVKYDDGYIQTFNKSNKRSRTKRGMYVNMNYDCDYKVGDKFKGGDIIAYSHAFKKGILTPGKNTVFALYSYFGGNYEDGWVATEPFLKNYKVKYLEKIEVVIPKVASVNTLITEVDTFVKAGDVLISYSKEKLSATDLSELITVDASDDLEKYAEILDNNIVIKSPGGKIIECNIYINNKKIDSLIMTKYEKLAKTTKAYVDACSKSFTEDKFECLDNATTTDVLKIGDKKYKGKLFDGALIEYYIEKEMTPDYGFKFVSRGHGNKGVVAHVIPKEFEPVTEETKLKIELMQSPLGVLGRKNLGLLIELALGKIFFIFNRRMKEYAAAGKYKQIKDAALKLYSYLDNTPEQIIMQQINAMFANYSEKQLLAEILKIEDNEPFFIAYVLPFKNKITIEQLEILADSMDIPLKERVYLPQYKTWTKEKVFVGILYIIQLEHFANTQYSVRSIGGYNSLTGQGLSGRRENSGSLRLGELDVGVYLDQGCVNILNELHNMHGDDFQSKDKIIFDIVQHGRRPISAKNESSDKEIKSVNLYKTYLNAAGLDFTIE